MASEEALKPVDDAEKAGNARWQQRTGHVYIYIHNIYIYIYIYIYYMIYIYIYCLIMMRNCPAKTRTESRNATAASPSSLPIYTCNIYTRPWWRRECMCKFMCVCIFTCKF
jgi:hypothetical protein